jgi:CBS domain containing-hemolysin-like protein
MLLLSALFSGAETGMYQMSWLRLRLGIEKKKFQFRILGKAIKSRTDFLITILIANNLTHYIMTTILTIILLGGSEDSRYAEFTATLIATPVIFVFGELIPKNVFFYRADSLMPGCSMILLSLKYVFTYTGIIPVLRVLSKCFNKLFSQGSETSENPFSTIPRRHIDSIIDASRHEQIFTPVQTELVSRFTNIPNLTLKTVMTPLHKNITCSIYTSKTELRKLMHNCDYTRIPVYKKKTNNIVGYINIYHCLSEDYEFDNLSDFVQPLHHLPANTPVNRAINVLQQKKQKILLVVKRTPAAASKPVGLVTMKDLAEELLGELSEW